jgi:hypothetical protein
MLLFLLKKKCSKSIVNSLPYMLENSFDIRKFDRKIPVGGDSYSVYEMLEYRYVLI